jgi:hypothetical protein
MKTEQKSPYRLLFLGCVLILIGYFGLRAVQYKSMSHALGEIYKVEWGHYNIHYVSYRRWHFGEVRTMHCDFPCAVIHFRHQTSPADTGTWVSASPEVFADNVYHAGEKVKIIYPPGQPQLAQICSVSEFWCPMPFMVWLGVAIFIWSAANWVIISKPWKMVDE